MKKTICSLLMLILAFAKVNAQVAIGTSTPDASAKFQIDATDKGFLPPRIALNGTNDVATILSPTNGLLIYNTASAGNGVNVVTPGMYYFSSGKWQRVYNQQPDATVDFNQLTPTTVGVIFTPNTPASTDVVYISSINGSQWTYNGASYVSYSPPASTAWYLSGGTNDAGNSKSGNIYRSGRVGLGASNPSNKLEITAESANASGLTFTNLNSSSPTSAGATLGVDANGKVVTVTGSSFSPVFGSASPSGAQIVNAGSSTLLSSITIPSNGTYLINYSMRVQPSNAINGLQYAVGYLATTDNPSTIILGTEILGAYSASNGTTTTSSGGNYSGSYIVTVTSAPMSLYFRGAAQGAQMTFHDDSNGRTKITYVKVTP